MAKKDIDKWLSYLQSTMNFEHIVRKVFDRIVHGQGQGVMILQGPSEIANKWLFLKLSG